MQIFELDIKSTAFDDALLGGSSTWARTKDLRIMYTQKMSSVSQVALPKRGYRRGYKISLKVKKSFIYMVFPDSFNRRQPTNTQNPNPYPVGIFFAYTPCPCVYRWWFDPLNFETSSRTNTASLNRHISMPKSSRWTPAYTKLFFRSPV